VPNYTQIAKNVKKTLSKSGLSVTLTLSTLDDYDPITNIQPITTTSETGKGAMFNYTRSLVDGTSIKSGDVLLYLDAETFSKEPSQEDKLTIDGEDYSIILCKPLKPAGIPVLYEVQIRNG